MRNALHLGDGLYSLSVAGFPNYTIDREGVVRPLQSNKILKPIMNNHGDLYFTLYRDDGSKSNQPLKTLYAKAFLPNPERKMDNTVVIKNGVQTDIFYENLCWRSRSYAIRYTRMLKNKPAYFGDVVAKETGTGRERYFKSIRQCAIYYGVLEHEVASSMVSGKRLHYAPEIEFSRPRNAI